MKLLLIVFLTGSLWSRRAAAHFFVEQLNGSAAPLRPIANQLGSENSPVTAEQIETDDVICNVARPFSAYATGPLTVAAGSNVTMHWTTTPGSAEPIGAAHYGPCHVHIGQGLKPTGWTKIFETTPDSANDWCTNIVANNGNNYVVRIPAALAPGDYVLRVHLVALHAAGSPGGAQFYPRCMDIRVTGSGTARPPFELTIPGAWNRNTPGVLFDLYTITNPADGSLYKGRYPSWGGTLWTGASSGTGTTTTTSRATTTTTTTTTTTSPRTSTTTTTTTSPRTTTTTSVAPTTTTTRTTTTTTTTRTTTTVSPSPTTGACAARWAQCGGLEYTGVTCCVSGTTCTVLNPYYFQCL